MRFLSTCAVIGTIATSAIAQDQPNTILVLDGSGSMWGQIDGVAKITIAQEVVSGLLEEFPTDQSLGLTVYGHRERGNCTDIDTIVAPAQGTVGEIVSAVNSIKQKRCDIPKTLQRSFWFLMVSKHATQIPALLPVCLKKPVSILQPMLSVLMFQTPRHLHKCNVLPTKPAASF